MDKVLISIVGPTAIGKTTLSITLAQHFKTEIISADSRQFFKEMQIGTAAPTPEELASAKHHFIHHKSVKDDYNVGTFEKDALACLKSIFKKHDIAIMVGGSGLYVDAITKGLDDFPEVNPKIRKELNLTFQKEGLRPLQERLKKLDLSSFNRIAIDNPHRVIRALEICLGTGKPYSSFISKKSKIRPFKTLSVGLTAPRELIYERINKRVDLMLSQGLLNEVKALEPYKHLNALNTVGYKEVFMYLNGDWSLDSAVEEIKKNSRRFAKRQLTWFKRNEDIIWFNYNDDVAQVIQSIEEQLN